MRVAFAAALLLCSPSIGHAANQQFQPAAPTPPPPPAPGETPASPNSSSEGIRLECVMPNGHKETIKIDLSRKTIDFIVADDECVTTVHLVDGQVTKVEDQGPCDPSPPVEKNRQTPVHIDITGDQIRYSYAQGNYGVVDRTTGSHKICDDSGSCDVEQCSPVERKF